VVVEISSTGVTETSVCDVTHFEYGAGLGRLIGEDFDIFSETFLEARCSTFT